MFKFMSKIYSIVLAHVIISVLPSMLVAQLACFVANKVILPITCLGGIKRAKRNGRELEAKLLLVLNNRIGEELVDAIYEYTYNNRKYRYQCSYIGNPPDVELLYFRRDPNYARPAKDYAQLESEWKPIFAVSFFVSFILSFFIL